MQFQAFLQHLGFAAMLALLSAALVRAMIAFPILDRPNARSAHVVPTPRGGGVGVVAAFVAGMVVLYSGAQYARIAEPQFIGVILAAVAIAAVSLADDIVNFRFSLKLAAQGAAALVAMGSGLVITRVALPEIGLTELGPLGPVLTLFWILACTNAVNFMDGLDGLVGGSLLIASIALCGIAALLGGWFVYAAALFLAAGLLGFLPFNLTPARIFMGDVGSQFLGFMMAVLAVAAARFEYTQVSFLIVPLLLFALLFDSGFTLLRRMAMGERVAQAHRTHLYQMAQRAGMPTAQIAAAHWGFATFHGLLALVFLSLAPWAKPLVLLPALLVQIAWLLLVARLVRRAGLSWRAG